MMKIHKVITSSLLIAALGIGMSVFAAGATCDAAGNIHHRGRTKSFFQRAVKVKKADNSIISVKKVILNKQK